MKPEVKVGTVLPIGTVVEIQNQCVVLENNGKQSEVSFADVETSLKGKKEYQHTPYITAGDRFYAIGAQDGSFPEIGWHINGEMGGLWNHPNLSLGSWTAGCRLIFRSFAGITDWRKTLGF